MRPLLLCLAPFALASGLAAQTTWIVNSGGGAQFTTIQPAIAAASPGDRIEVQGPGPYPAFVVDRGVDVVAIANAVCASVEVQGVPAGSRARVADFRVTFGPNSSVKVMNCAGSVLLSNLTPAATLYSTVAHPGLEITNCPTVFVDRGSYTGIHGFAISGGDSSGALITNSSVVMVGSTLTGNDQLGPTSPLGSYYDPGFPAIKLVGGHLVLSGTVLHPGPSSSWPSIHTGTPALFIQSGFAQLLGGCQANGQQNAPSPGYSIIGSARYTPDNVLVGPLGTSASGATPSPIPARPSLTTPATTSLGTNYALSFVGQPALTTFFALDFRHGHHWMPAFEGSFHLTGNAVLLAITLDAQGLGSYGFPVPNLPAARHLDIFAQGCALAGGTFALTAPAVTRTQ